MNNNRNGQKSPNNRFSNMSPSERARYEEYQRRKRVQSARNAERKKALEKQKRQKRRKENMKIFVGRLVLFFIVLFLVLGVAFALFMLFFRSTPDAPKSKGNISYLYGGSEKRSAPAADCITSGGVYLCFNDLSEYLGMAESGSSKEMKFILNVTGSTPQTASGNGDEEYVIFYPDGKRVKINGQTIVLDIPNYIKNEEVWVSLSFVKNYMANLSVTYNEKKAEVSVSRIIEEGADDSKEKKFQPVSFMLKNASNETPVSEDPLIGDIVFDGSGTYDLAFNTDLTEYEEYMNPDGNMRDAFLTLVNDDHPLTAGDSPNDLVDVKYSSQSRETQKLRLYACRSLDALFKEMYSLEYYDMVVYGGYRSYSYQDTLFSQYISNEMAANPSLSREQAEAIVLTYSPEPGTSEHQTGLAVDMDTMGAYTTDFKNTEEYRWLSENAWKFGFILRYPEDKTDITKNDFEPWHFRYVGRYHALKIHESGLCLEEYLAEIHK